ncbi:hypothetical protein GJ496_011223 [Pomphorhynchus laevis]|nr:hypothetical protein GJ496_011223 [Pomphorhynchus laevis]
MKSVRSHLSKNLDYYKIVFSDGIILSKKERNVLTMALNFMMSPPVIERISVKTALNRLSNDVFQDEKEEAKHTAFDMLYGQSILRQTRDTRINQT